MTQEEIKRQLKAQLTGKAIRKAKFAALLRNLLNGSMKIEKQGLSIMSLKDSRKKKLLIKTTKKQNYELSTRLY